MNLLKINKLDTHTKKDEIINKADWNETLKDNE